MIARAAICASNATPASVIGVSQLSGPSLRKRLDPDEMAPRVVNLVNAWNHEIKEMLGGMGLNSIDSLRGNRLMLRGIGLNDKELEILGIRHAGE